MKDYKILCIKDAYSVISVLKPQFDSHDFITIYILTFTTHYLELLKKYKSVETTHQQIGQFLQQHSDDLNISKQGEIESENILGNYNVCTLWKKYC